MAQNKNIFLVMGRPNSGKSASLMSLSRQNKFAYFNCDLKEIPFPDSFAINVEVVDPLDIISFIQDVEEADHIEGAVIDTLTFLMSTYERLYVSNAANTQKAWGAYGEFYKELIHTIKSGTKDYIILAHEDTVLNEQTMSMDTKVPVKGAVGKTGVEADFTTIVSAKQIPVKKLKEHPNALLNITSEEEEDGIKRVFVTRITKDTLGEKMRSPINLWKREELYIDNNVEQVFARLKSY